MSRSSWASCCAEAHSASGQCAAGQSQGHEAGLGGPAGVLLDGHVAEEAAAFEEVGADLLAEHPGGQQQHVDVGRRGHEAEGEHIPGRKTERGMWSEVRGDVGRVHLRDHLVGQQHIHHVGPRHGGGDVGHVHAVAGSGLPVLVVTVAHHHCQPAVAQIEGHRAAKVTIAEDRHCHPVEDGQVGVVSGVEEVLCCHVELLGEPGGTSCGSGARMSSAGRPAPDVSVSARMIGRSVKT